jgi:hypothetical protein
LIIYLGYTRSVPRPSLIKYDSTLILYKHSMMLTLHQALLPSRYLSSITCSETVL